MCVGSKRMREQLLVALMLALFGPSYYHHLILHCIFLCLKASDPLTSACLQCVPSVDYADAWPGL